MGPNLCYLITLCNGKELMRIALHARREVEYYMEPDGQQELKEQLPKDRQSWGNIVHVENLDDVVIHA